MVETLVEALVIDMRTSVHGELSSRTQIVDHLLDLRLACRDHVAVLPVIDRLLGELPGRTTVANAWWLEGLMEIERTFRSGVAAAVNTTGPLPATRQPGPGGAPLPRRRPQR